MCETYGEKNKGENHPRAKLTEKQVIEVRQRYIDGEEIDDIWSDFKDIYSRDTFKNIIFGQAYKYVGKIPIETIKALREERETLGTSYPKLGAKYGMSTGTAHKIATYQLYKNV